MDLTQVFQNPYLGYVLLIFFVLFLYLWTTKSGRSHRQTLLTVFNIRRQGTKVHHPTSLSTADGLTPGETAKVGGAAIDLNNTGQTAVFVGTGKGQSDMLLVNVKGKLVNIIDQTNLSSNNATYAAVSVDIDYNGYTDLVVAREDGVTLYKNYGKGQFKAQKILKGNKKTIPVSLAVSDYNKDGHMDLYVSQKVHPQLAKTHPNTKWSTNNTLLENLGAGIEFENVTQLTNSGGSLGQTKFSTFVDLNNDRIPDLVLIQDTGELEIQQGTRGASGDYFTSGFQFIKRRVPTGLGYVTNIKIGDYNNDGLPDLLLTSKNKHSRTQQEQVVLLNGGNFNFVPTNKNKLKDLDLGWQALMEDLKLIKTRTDPDQLDKVSGQADKPVPVDLDGDGRPDLLWINVHGPTELTQGQSNQNNYVNVKLPNRIPFLNSTVTVISINDQTGQRHTQTQQSLHGLDGVDGGNILNFNLGQDTRILYLQVRTIYDNVYTHPYPKINTTLAFRDAKL